MKLTNATVCANVRISTIACFIVNARAFFDQDCKLVGALNIEITEYKLRLTNYSVSVIKTSMLTDRYPRQDPSMTVALLPKQAYLS